MERHDREHPASPGPGTGHGPPGGGHYRRLMVMVALHFAAMYVLMYAMVDVPGNVYHSLNQLYMAGLMTGSMLVIEVPVMRAMYPAKTLNRVLTVAGAAAVVGFFLLIRQQAAISDRQFLRSMIPHHAGAILMCEEASLTDPELLELCRGIVAGQQEEIDFMRGKLDR